MVFIVSVVVIKNFGRMPKFLIGGPNENRTRISALKGQRPDH